MVYQINQAAVIGAGVMGAEIAALLTNNGVSVLLLDRLPDERSLQDKENGLSEKSPGWRNQIAQTGVNLLLRSKRPVFNSEESVQRVTLGNTEDDLSKIADCDWVIETIIEKMEIKHDLFNKLVSYLKPGTIVSTNTSGLPINQVCNGFSPEFQQHFLGIHFFNPPTWAQLMGIIPHQGTQPEIVDFMYDFLKNRLGKKPIITKDTPNFIANRLGNSTTTNAFHLSLKHGIRVDEADELCGKNMGRMQSAMFATIDGVGLDTVCNVTRNLYEIEPNDERRDTFTIPAYAEHGNRRNSALLRSIKWML